MIFLDEWGRCEVSESSGRGQASKKGNKKWSLDHEHLRRLEEEVSAWPSISVHPHRFGGKGFLFHPNEARSPPFESEADGGIIVKHDRPL